MWIGRWRAGAVAAAAAVAVFLAAGCSSPAPGTGAATTGRHATPTTTRTQTPKVSYGPTEPGTVATIPGGRPLGMWFAGRFESAAGKETWFSAVASYGALGPDVTIVFGAGKTLPPGADTQACTIASSIVYPAYPSTEIVVSNTAKQVLVDRKGQAGSC